MIECTGHEERANPVRKHLSGTVSMSIHLQGVVRGKRIELESETGLPDGAAVSVEIRGPMTPPTVGNGAQRKEILHRVVARMRQNVIPGNAPRFTRDQLHERD